MNNNLTEVFNTYNVNILFTVAALPSRVSKGFVAPPIGGGGLPSLMQSGSPPKTTSIPPINKSAIPKASK